MYRAESYTNTFPHTSIFQLLFYYRRNDKVHAILFTYLKT